MQPLVRAICQGLVGVVALPTIISASSTQSLVAAGTGDASFVFVVGDSATGAPLKGVQAMVGAPIGTTPYVWEGTRHIRVYELRPEATRHSYTDSLGVCVISGLRRNEVYSVSVCSWGYATRASIDRIRTFEVGADTVRFMLANHGPPGCRPCEIFLELDPREATDSGFVKQPTKEPRPSGNR
jgi:hypothetical protein